MGRKRVTTTDQRCDSDQFFFYHMVRQKLQKDVWKFIPNARSVWTRKPLLERVSHSGISSFWIAESSRSSIAMIITDNENQDQGTASNNKIMEADSSAMPPPPPYVASESPSDYVPIQNHHADHAQPLLLPPRGSPLKRFAQAFAVAILIIFLARSLLWSIYLASSGHRHGGRHADLPTQKVSFSLNPSLQKLTSIPLAKSTRYQFGTRTHDAYSISFIVSFVKSDYGLDRYIKADPQIFYRISSVCRCQFDGL